MRKISKLTIALVICACVLSVVAFVLPQSRPTEVISGWGDNSDGGGRPSYTLDEINADTLKDAIIFNTISDSVNGNEKNFVSAREYDDPTLTGEDHVWNTQEVEVEDGQEYIIRAYIHNNNPHAENIAENVRVLFGIPTNSDTNIPVYGFIMSDNAEPSKYWDGVLFKSNSNFHLEYVYGSACLYNNGVGSKGLQLNDDVVTKESGQQIGYYDYRTNPEDPVVLDGIIPGGYQYASYVAIRVRAILDTDFRVTQQIRLKGDTEWHNYVDAEVGDEIEIQFQYQNTDRRENTHENVSVRDVLPSNLEYVPGSTVLYNAKSPDGVPIDQDDITTNGIYIGSYEIGANAYIRFTARVVDTNLADGITGLVNWSQACVNDITIQDYATVRVHKE